MRRLTRLCRFVTACCLVSALAGPAMAERLALSFLPPDFPPSDICNAPPEETDEGDLVESAPAAEGLDVLETRERLRFLIRDIRDLSKEGADVWFDYIMGLISRRAGYDNRFAGAEETLARIDLYLAAGRLVALKESGLVPHLTNSLDTMTGGQKVRLARLYDRGLGVDADPDFAMQLIAAAAFVGNSDAAFTLLRRQLRGDPTPGWDLPPERTATLAFGGLIGQLNPGLCGRAERMAREYLDGDILRPNPDLAYAWRRFAADMGGAEAAWRVVEHHLNATGAELNDAELQHYLQLAVGNAVGVSGDDLEAIAAANAKTEGEVREILGVNHARTGLSGRSSVVPYLELEVNPFEEGMPETGEYLDYLLEIATPDAPPPVLTRLAREILFRKGRWAGDEAAMPYLESATRAGYGEAMRLLAELRLRRPEGRDAAERLLTDAATVAADAEAMRDLDNLYRCRLPGAPMRSEADFWSAAYRAADTSPVPGLAAEFAALDSGRDAETIGKLQSLALNGHAGATAAYVQFRQSDPLIPEAALRYWGRRMSASDLALKAFAIGEYEIALTAAQRDNAEELMRRIYLDLGPTIALDTAVTLVDHEGRDPEAVAPILDILKVAAVRGEGAAIRLIQRLTGVDPAAVYHDYAGVIETRGDFLALMVAAPHVPEKVFDDYMLRAASVMNCNTKDAYELAEAYAGRGRTEGAAHWIAVALAMETGSSLSKLGLSDRKMAQFGRDGADGPEGRDLRAVADGDPRALRAHYLLAAEPGGGFDAGAAARDLIALLGSATPETRLWALQRYVDTDPRIRAGIDRRFDVTPVYAAAAEEGDPQAMLQFGRLLRLRATGPAELAVSADWLSKAAEAGLGDAMVDYAEALGFGIGVPADPGLALIWLAKAEGLGNTRAPILAATLRAMTGR